MKVIDITEKLNFTEKPKIIIRGTEITVNNSAVTMLKIMPKVSKKKIEKLAFEKFGDLSGIAQQYLFYWRREA